VLTRPSRLPESAEFCHSERAEAGEESLLSFCFESGGILRFAQNDNSGTFSATC